MGEDRFQSENYCISKIFVRVFNVLLNEILCFAIRDNQLSAIRLSSNKNHSRSLNLPWTGSFHVSHVLRMLIAKHLYGLYFEMILRLYDESLLCRTRWCCPSSERFLAGSLRKPSSFYFCRSSIHNGKRKTCNSRRFDAVTCFWCT